MSQVQESRPAGWYLPPRAWRHADIAVVRERTLLVVRPGAMLPTAEPPRANRSKRG